MGRQRASITCPICQRTSYNPNDVRERYCGYCHEFLDLMLLSRELKQRKLQQEMEALREALQLKLPLS